MREADEAMELLAKPGDRGSVQSALNSVYRDLGAHFHDLVRGRAPVSRAGFAAADDDHTSLPEESEAPEESSGWYTEEEETNVPMFTDGDFGGTDLETEIPESQTLTNASDPDSNPEDLPLVTLAALKRDSRSSGDLARLRPGADPAPWLEDLQGWLDMLSPPDDLLDLTAMPEEASRVQWATTQLDRLISYPHAIQLAVIAMLAARALHLASHLDVDVGPRMALDRLKRFRDIHALPYVGGLMPGPRPELSSWAEDAQALWHLLRPTE